MPDLSEEQEKKLWEWCGVGEKERYIAIHSFPWHLRVSWPPLTLDNLFKWAVPKLSYCTIVANYLYGELGYSATVTCKSAHKSEYHSDPAQALAQAILKAIES